MLAFSFGSSNAATAAKTVLSKVLRKRLVKTLFWWKFTTWLLNHCAPHIRLFVTCMTAGKWQHPVCCPAGPGRKLPVERQAAKACAGMKV